MPSPDEDTPAVVALRKSLEADRRQLAELTSRIARQDAELAALLSASSADVAADTPKSAGARGAFSPTKKRKYEEMDSPPAKLKTDTSQSDDPIVQVMTDPMLLGTPRLAISERHRAGPFGGGLQHVEAYGHWPQVGSSLEGARLERVAGYHAFTHRCRSTGLDHLS